MMSLFFIIGNPRSGTSLFRLMLNSHEHMTVPPECGFALWLAQEYRDFEPSIEIYKDFVKDVLSSRKMETWGLSEADILDAILSREPENYAGLVECVYQSYALKNGKVSDVFGDKNNFYIESLGRLTDTFPLSKLIFVVRDGRDVACSYLELNQREISSVYKPRLASSISDIAEEWQRNAEAAKHHLEEGALLVRYEDLIMNPEEELSRVCEYLGLQFSASMLDYYKSNDEPFEFMQWKAKTKEKPDPENKSKYLKKLKKSEILEFEAIAGEGLRYFSYI